MQQPMQTSMQDNVAALRGDHRVAAVVDIVERLSFAGDLQGIMEIVRTSARQLTGADGVTFVLRENDQCYYADESAISPLWKGQRFPMQACVSGWAMLNGRTVVIPDIYKDPRVPHDAYRLTFVKSMVMVPVRPEDPVGAIGAYWATQHAASEEELAILQAIARSTALALTNLQLVASLREAARRAEGHAAELTRANAAKTQFLASASHDLRQPVQSILMLTEAIGSHIAEGGQPHYLQLQQSLGVLKGLLDSLLDVSKIDAGLVEPKVKDVPLASVFDQIEATFRQGAEANGLAWYVVPSAAVVRTDPLLLLRILHNLVENAVRYTDEGRILIDNRRKGEVIRIEVQDSGRGIPAEAQDEIFNEFYQVGNPERDRSYGLGMGLAIVKKLAGLLKHEVGVASRAGEGSTFWIEIPVAPGQHLPVVRARPQTLDGAGRLIVLVEDDVIVRMALQAMFEGWGFRVIAVESGEEAVEQLRASGEAPSIILADYRLRQRRLGTDAIRCIEAFLGRPAPALVLTGEIGGACDKDAAASGYPVLRKPVTPDQLQAAILQRIAEVSLGGTASAQQVN
ncbi:hybrid sensor histidine kinase/response regulator [Azospirillum sp.]|uniref:hybrid sensor histidine kinase/response regulator n=1 Tax=Azospirillum sp. TaxID=34012 RepID=UPI003D765FC6